MKLLSTRKWFRKREIQTQNKMTKHTFVRVSSRMFDSNVWALGLSPLKACGYGWLDMHYYVTKSTYARPGGILWFDSTQRHPSLYDVLLRTRYICYNSKPNVVRVDLYPCVATVFTQTCRILSRITGQRHYQYCNGWLPWLPLSNHPSNNRYRGIRHISYSFRVIIAF